MRELEDPLIRNPRMSGAPGYYFAKRLLSRTIAKRLNLLRRKLHLQRPLLAVDAHRTFFLECVTPKAAPLPFFRRRDQPALHRIAMHVAQLLNLLLWRGDVEVIEPLLPDPPGGGAGAPLIRGVRMSGFTVQDLGETFFDHLHHDVRVADFRLRDEKVEVLRHHHISDDQKAIS